MPLQNAKATFEALQMGIIYASEIGDEASLKEIKRFASGASFK